MITLGTSPTNATDLSSVVQTIGEAPLARALQRCAALGIVSSSL
ncbi:hypothetical protein JMJ77_0009164, partial [Colletotrichum scovillei]